VVTISFVGAASTAHRLLVPVGFVGLGLGLLPEPSLPDVPWPSLLGCLLFHLREEKLVDSFSGIVEVVCFLGREHSQLQ
jgi:hypothetical protein